MTLRFRTGKVILDGFLALILCAPLQAVSGTSLEEEFRQTIASVEKAIVDLTDSTAPLRCEQFRSSGKSLTETNATVLVSLITDHKLTSQQEIIAALLTTYLPEETYWKVNMPILESSTNEMLLMTVIACPLPYGPGYANAHKVEPYKTQLRSILKNPHVNTRVKRVVERVLSGKAAKNFLQFKKDPSEFGY